MDRSLPCDAPFALCIANQVVNGTPTEFESVSSAGVLLNNKHPASESRKEPEC
jgi:hypothetical protein